MEDGYLFAGFQDLLFKMRKLLLKLGNGLFEGETGGAKPTYGSPVDKSATLILSFLHCDEVRQPATGLEEVRKAFLERRKSFRKRVEG